MSPSVSFSVYESFKVNQRASAPFNCINYDKTILYINPYLIPIKLLLPNSWLLILTYVSSHIVPQMIRAGWSLFDRGINFFVVPARLTFIFWGTITLT
ncbi:hypothetical protein BpHYR1_030294 [Brachionus plicatilis]|uniref:Uncharacterized protein n=1 Tax=Brachionus plicatilis TaxID=10195 RepID=A0A3M7QW15_BRAPC|nr:hypothetical protein BpHYR1_030294 [Brachionus plicatilis]